MIVDKLNVRDYGIILAEWLCILLFAGVLCYSSGKGPELFLVFSLFVILYLCCFAYAAEHYYVYEDSGSDLHKGLSRAVKWFVLCMLLCIAVYCLPYRLHLYLVVSALMCSVLPPHLGLAESLLIVLTIILCGAGSPYEILHAVMLLMLGMLCSTVLKQEKYHFESSLIIIAISFVTYFISAYCSNLPLGLWTAALALVEGFFNLAVLFFALPRLKMKSEKLQTISLGEAIEDDFPLVKTIRSISEEKYKHARLVSALCFRCAKVVGLNENLSCCAGLFYTLCDSDAEHPVEYAVRMAENYRLPVEVRRILNQYQGKKEPMTSQEAVLVDLIDEVVSRFEMGNTQDCEGFNKQMIIIRTFDEISGSGRYDRSGFGINMYLKTRKYLIEEAEFSDIIIHQ